MSLEFLELKVPPVVVVAAATLVKRLLAVASPALVLAVPFRQSTAISIVAFGILIALAGVAVFIAYMNRYQIEPEERALQAQFGAVFADYRRLVRRWI